MLKKAMVLAATLALTTLLAAPWVLAQQEDTSTDPSEPGFTGQPMFFCGYITGNPDDKCTTDANGVNITPDGTTFTVDNGIVTFSDGRTLVIDRPPDTGFLQYQTDPELCAPPMVFGSNTIVGPPMPCRQSVQPYPLPPVDSI